jgi:3-deoxy-D-manno-octulosonic-acid transferase
MLALYNTLGLLARPLAAGWAAWRRRDPRLAGEWDQRMARELPARLSGAVWLHGASVGEARLVTALARRFGERFPELPRALSATTRTGLERLPSDASARFLLPLDFRGFPSRVLDRIEPRLLVLLETELWPNLIHEAAARGIPIALINARLAPTRIRRYRRFSALYRPLVERFDYIGAQSADDAERFESLGARSSVEVTGNMKFDLSAPLVDRAALERRLGGLDGRPVLIAGSTRPGEERVVLESFGTLRRSFPTLLLMLAPRHLERVDEVAGLVREAGWRPDPWSALDGGRAERPDVVLVDTLGELASLYGIATVAFVGGSLEPFGGHSPLEPAVTGTPVLFGPHTGNFEESTRLLVDGGGARRLRGGVELTAAASAWFADPGLRDAAGRAAAEVVREHSGATTRTFDALASLLQARPL